MLPRIVLTIAVLLLLAAVPFRADAADEPVAQATDDTEFLEINYKGQTTRVPIRNGVPEKLDLGGNQLRLQFERTPSADKPSSADRPSPVAAPSAEPAQPVPPPERWSREMIVMASVMGGVLVCVLGYFFVVDPMLRRRS